MAKINDRILLSDGREAKVISAVKDIIIVLCEGRGYMIFDHTLYTILDGKEN